jgi:hypothetical protein
VTNWDAIVAVAGCFRPYLGTGEAPSVVADREAWPSLVAYASAEFLAPALGCALEGDARVPEDASAFLMATRDLNRERNATHRDALFAIIRDLNRRGIEPMLLKGAALLAVDPYRDPGFRMMRDLDLLVADEQIPDAVAVAVAHGFCSENVELPPDAPHVPPLLDLTRGIKLEVHRALLMRKYRDLMPLAPLWDRASRVQRSTVRFVVPAWTDFAMHAVVHSQLAHRAHRLFHTPVRTLLELAALERAGVGVDWDEIAHRFAVAGMSEVIGDVAMLTGELLGVTLAQPAIRHSRGTAGYRRAANDGRFAVWRRLIAQSDEWISSLRDNPRRLRRLLSPPHVTKVARGLVSLVRPAFAATLPPGRRGEKVRR